MFSPLQVPKSQLERMYSNTLISVAAPPPVTASTEAQPPVSAVQPQPTAEQQPAPQAAALPVQQPRSQHDTTVTAIPLVTSSGASSNVRTFSTDLTVEPSSIPVESMINQSGLELSTIDPSSHHQLLGHMPLVATSAGEGGHMQGNMTETPQALTGVGGQTGHQGAAVISQFIHPNSYLTGLSNGMSLPPSHLSHSHPHYQM